MMIEDLEQFSDDTVDYDALLRLIEECEEFLENNDEDGGDDNDEN